MLKNYTIILASGSRDEFIAHLHNTMGVLFNKNSIFKIL